MEVCISIVVTTVTTSTFVVIGLIERLPTGYIVVNFFFKNLTKKNTATIPTRQATQIPAIFPPLCPVELFPFPSPESFKNNCLVVLNL